MIFLPRLRIERPDRVDIVHGLVEAAAEELRQLAELARLQEAHVLFDDRLGGSPLHVVERKLDQEAFLEVPRAHAGRVELLDQVQGQLHFLRGVRPHRGDLLGRCLEIAVLVQVADDGAADLLLSRRDDRHVELPEKMVGQALRLA